MSTIYPKRLIEVDLPIARISAHARREKSIRHGHISTLHIWWARRPLAACRAVICAALWPDPADPLCPALFRKAAIVVLTEFAKRVNPQRISLEGRQLQEFASEESSVRWEALSSGSLVLDLDATEDLTFLRMALLDFIADFSNWDNSTVPAYVETCHRLTQAAHESLGGLNGSKPLVIDPFAGGGSIPLEALRVGADAFASDLNSVPVLLNKVLLEYIPKFGKQLAEQIRKWGNWIKQDVENDLDRFYPCDPDGATPIAYLWARTIRCDGPACGAEIPLIRSLWLSKSGSESIAFRLIVDTTSKKIDFQILERVRGSDVGDGTVKRSAATCPVCGYTTPASRVRELFASRRGGASDARMLAVRYDDPKTGRRGFRVPSHIDIAACEAAKQELIIRENRHQESLSLVPDEELPYLRSIFNINLLGVNSWGMLFTPRQALSLTTFANRVRCIDQQLELKDSAELRLAVKTCLALSLDRLADFNSSLCVLNSTGGRGVVHTFGRQALGIVWDFMETNPFNDVAANWDAGISAFERYIERESNSSHCGVSNKSSAVASPLPTDSADLFVTDPPYYDAVPYADLSDFFYVWLKRMIGTDFPELFSESLTAKDGEIVQLAERNKKYAFKTREYFEKLMQEAMAEGRRVLTPTGLGIVVFAHKTTTGWRHSFKP